MHKATLRESARNYLQKLTNEQKRLIENIFVTTLIKHPIWQQAETIGITLSQGLEWNTAPFVEMAWEQGKTVCVPKCRPQEKQLEFYRLDSYQQLERVYFNLLEPNPDESTYVPKQSLDLLIVPGLLFDRQGFRIGFGGGYYDRYLADFANETVSLASIEQVVDTLPVEPFDCAVNYIMTEKGFITGKGE